MSAGFDSAFFRQLERLRIRAHRRLPGLHVGERLGVRYGSSVEFMDFRPYSPGDDPRYVDWNVYARLDRLVVKLFSEERDLCLHLLLDASASMGVGTPSKLDYAARLGAALGYVALARHERLALGFFDDAHEAALRPVRGRRQVFRLLDALAARRAEGTTAVGPALARYAAASRSPGVAVVVSDLLEPEPTYQAGLTALGEAGFEVQLVHLLAEEELEPSLAGDLRLVDGEAAGGGAREVTAERRTLERYRENLERFCAEVARFCRRRGIAYVRTSNTLPFEELVYRRLREGRLLA